LEQVFVKSLKKNNRKTVPYLVSIFCSYLSLNLGLFGGLVFGATQLKLSSTLKPAALMVGIYAISSIFALILQNYVIFKYKFKSLEIICLLLILISCLFLSIPMSALWIIALIVQATFLNWYGALTLSNIPKYFSNIERTILNKLTQQVIIVASLIGSALGPVLVLENRINRLFGVVLVLSLIAIISQFLLNRNVKDADQNIKNSATYVTNDQNLFPTFLKVFLVWLMGGFFYVIEVPILKERFGLENNQISAVFFLTIASSLLATVLIKNSLLKNNDHKLLMISSFSCILLSVIYAQSSILFLSLAAVALIGAFNGMLNLSYTQIINKLEDEKKRISSFLFVRGLTQTAVFLSAVISSFNSIEIILKVITYASVFAIFLMLYFKVNYKTKRLPCLMIILALVFQPSWGYAESLRELKIALQQTPMQTAPYKIRDISSSLVANQIYQGLYSYGDDNFIKPVLASRHEWSKNMLELKIYLRKGNKFSNGLAVTAESVVAALTESIQYLKEESAWAFGDVKGYKNFIATNENKSFGIKNINNDYVKIEFSKKSPLFLHYLAAPYFLIFTKDKTGNILGSGNYIASDVVQNKIVLKAKGDAYYSRLVFSATNTSIAKMSKNEFKKYDLIHGVTSYNNIEGYELIKYPLLQAVVLVFNTTTAKFKESKIRCQVGQQISDTFSEHIVYNWQPTALGVPLNWSLTKNNTKNNIKKLSELPEIKILYADSAATFVDKVKIIQPIEKQKIQFFKTTMQELLSLAQKKNFDAFILGYIPDIIHLDGLLTPLIGTNQQFNFSGYSNNKLDTLLLAAKSSLIKGEQSRFYTNAFSIIANECPVVFLGAQQGQLYKNNKVVLPRFDILGFHHIDLSKAIGE